MKKIKIAENLIDSSEAIFGTWALGGGYWGNQQHSDSVKAIHAAIRAGINHFDTAPVYGNGLAEQLIGQQLRKNRQDFIISTKCFHKDLYAFNKSLDMSLKRLNTNYIDIFYIHWPQSNVDMRPVMDQLENYRREGIIRAIGLSNFSLDQIKPLMDAGKVDMVQCGFNLFWRKEEVEFLPFCKKNGITTSAYSILAQGILSGKYKSIPETEAFKYRKKMVLFDNGIFEKVNHAVIELEQIAKKHHISSSEAAIFWTKENPLLDCSILGCRNRKQTEDNLKPFFSEYPKELTEQLEKLSLSVQSFVPTADNIFRHKT